MATEEEIRLLIKGRDLVDAYKADAAREVDSSAQLAKSMQELGFRDVQDFLNFNERLCTEALRNMPIYGACDLCAGLKDDTPWCQKRFGAYSCKAFDNVLGTEDTMYRAVLQRLQLGDWGRDDWDTTMANFEKLADTDGKLWFCPKPHGYYIIPKTAKRGQFTLSWR
jgi:hypothetical protein